MDSVEDSQVGASSRCRRTKLLGPAVVEMDKHGCRVRLQDVQREMQLFVPETRPHLTTHRPMILARSGLSMVARFHHHLPSLPCALIGATPQSCTTSLASLVGSRVRRREASTRHRLSSGQASRSEARDSAAAHLPTAISRGGASWPGRNPNQPRRVFGRRGRRNEGAVRRSGSRTNQVWLPWGGSRKVPGHKVTSWYQLPSTTEIEVDVGVGSTTTVFRLGQTSLCPPEARPWERPR
ncbi:hypothetical protein QBC39DRAFT_160593 [Podospora conica]|nr:hypothetical protein QBC39DRAFT_160593 [Schizothecium conicum]